MIAARRMAGTTPRRCAASVACALFFLLWPATSAALDRIDRFLGTVQVVKLVRGRVRAAFRTKYTPTALVAVKIEILTVGGAPFDPGGTVVLPMSRPEKDLGPLARVVGRTYSFSVSSRRAGGGLTISRIDADPLAGGRRRDGPDIVLVGPPVRKPKPLPPEKRPRPGIYTRHLLVSGGVGLADVCVGPDGLVYWLHNHHQGIIVGAIDVGKGRRKKGETCFGVFDVKKGRLTALKRGLRDARIICSAGDRVFWVEEGTKARGFRDGRLSSYDPRTGKTKVLLDDVPGALDIAGGPGGEVYILQADCTLSVVRKGGTERATLARGINQPARVAAGPKGDVFVLHLKRDEKITLQVLRFPPGGGKGEVVLASPREADSGMLVGLATDARGNLYLAYEGFDGGQIVTIRALVGGDPRKDVPLSVDPAYDLAVLPSGDLLVRHMSTLWLFDMKKKVENLLRRR